MKLKLLNDLILVKLDKAKKETDSGIILAGTAAIKTNMGIVVEVGPGRTYDNGILKPMSLNVGDRVLFGKFTNIDINSLDENMKIMRESDIMAIIKE